MPDSEDLRPILERSVKHPARWLLPFALAEADIVIQSGFGLEKFLEDNLLLAGSTAPFVALSDGIEPIRLADGSGEIDPHVWLDPRNVMVWTTNAGEAMARLDPDHGDGYRQRAEAYRLELEALDRRASDGLALIPPDQRQLVTDHDTLGYFAVRLVSRSSEPSSRRQAAPPKPRRGSWLPWRTRSGVKGCGRCSSPPKSIRTWHNEWRMIPVRAWSPFIWSR